MKTPFALGVVSLLTEPVALPATGAPAPALRRERSAAILAASARGRDAPSKLDFA